MRGLALAGALLASYVAAAGGAAPPCEGAKVSLVSFTDLPRDDARSHNLSGLVWDDATKQLRAVSDKDPWLVTLTFDADFQHAQLGQSLKLTDVPLLARWDGEALVRRGSDWLIADEAGPTLFVVAQDGRVKGTLPVPAKLARARFNLGVEGLALLDGQTLLVALEQSLTDDGAPATHTLGTVVRFFLRRDGQPDRELAYRTDPAWGDDGDVGVSEVAALGGDAVLVLERAFAKGRGNRVRLYCTRASGPDVSSVEHLGPDTPALEKRLLLDLATLPAAGVPASPGPQANPLLDNYEGLAVGPRLADGRRLLFLVSDDNSRKDQVPRVLVLAVSGL